jgi:oligogalacturonide lyase
MPGVEIEDYLSPETDLVCPYFHQRFVTPDCRFLICEGVFAGVKEAVRLDLETGEAVRLTEGGAIVHVGDLDPAGERFYFVRGPEVWRVEVATGKEERVAEVKPQDGAAILGFVHFSADGSFLAMGGNRVHASGVKLGRVYALDPASGELRTLVERPFQIGHVQCSPTDPDVVMYCHETGGASPQRMWLARLSDGTTWPLYHNPGHPWVTHETFTGDGQHVVFIRNPEGMGLIRPDNSEFRAVDLPRAWHPGPNHDGSLLAFDSHDGYVGVWCSASGRSQLLATSELGPGAPHLHPCFLPDERTVVWTSSGNGRPHPALARGVGA